MRKGVSRCLLNQLYTKEWQHWKCSCNFSDAERSRINSVKILWTSLFMLSKCVFEDWSSLSKGNSLTSCETAFLPHWPLFSMQLQWMWMTWGWVNSDRIFSYGWNIPFICSVTLSPNTCLGQKRHCLVVLDFLALRDLCSCLVFSVSSGWHWLL